MDGNGEGEIPVGDPVRLQFDQGIAQPVGFRRRRRVHHRRRASFGFLNVGGHRVALREVMALRSPDFAPGRIEALRTPFERHRQGRIEPVKLL